MHTHQIAQEANADGIPGPTHSYGGLSLGNLASLGNKGLESSPRQAVKQGLKKMKMLADWGIPQFALPPHERPNIPFLRGLGFSGDDARVWESAWKAFPQGAWAAASSSAMWAANAATIAPSVDTADGRLHATPANLLTMLHRSTEGAQTRRALQALMPGDRFAIHEQLHCHSAFSDEGAANHVRLCAEHGAPGVHLFVYGREAFHDWNGQSPARQTLSACRAISGLHQLDPKRTVFTRQSSDVIFAGAFHNDVVCVGTTDTLFFHELAFAEKDAAIEAIKRAADGLFEPQFVEIAEADLPIADAVKAYLFNSQLLVVPGRPGLTLLAPMESHDTPSAKAVTERLVSGNGPIRAVEFVDVRQSMRNGGGPACLRLRIVMTDAELAAANQGMRLDDTLFAKLNAWADQYYRDSLTPAELPDPALIGESRMALDALSGILGLGSDFYPFQR